MARKSTSLSDLGCRSHAAANSSKNYDPYYQHFLETFPDVACLARAAESEVLASWAGLGYYARAKNLHLAARTIIDNYNGEFPGAMREFMNLPGIGRYTAGAVYSIAFNQPQPIVDGNVRRVISRLHGLVESPSENFFWKQATAWIPAGKASTFNQAVMELGALICIPSRPSCRQCPVYVLCLAAKNKLQEQIPPARPKPTPEFIHLLIMVLQRENSILLTTDKPAAYIPGIWGLPHALLARESDARRAAHQLMLRILKKSVPIELCARIHHAITFRRITAHVFRGNLNQAGISLATIKKLHWVPFEGISRWSTSSLFRKALSASTAAKKAEKKGERKKVNC